MSTDSNVLFLKALPMPEAQRGAFLDAACGGDADLRRRVEAMLADDRAADAFFDDCTAGRILTFPEDACAEQILLEGILALKPGSSFPEWTPPSAESLTGTIAGIEVVRLLGCGGMGAVYEAWQVSLDRRVAVKLLPAELALDKEFVTRFRLEGRLLAKLLHPRIVTIFDGGESRQGHPYLLMEFMEGESLSRRLERGPLNADIALSLFIQIAEAVAAAHEQGVVHRDLKPANILLTKNGGAKVADFGLAGIIGANGCISVRHSGTVRGREPAAGTPGYSPPEQYDGANGVGPPSDVFSLAVIGCELLTGRLPDRLPPPASQFREVLAPLVAVLRRALRVNPLSRPANGQEFLSMVRKALDAITKAELRRRELRRRRAAAASFARSLTRFSDAVAELYTPAGTAGFPGRIVGAMQRLLSSDFICYNEFGSGHFVASGSPQELTTLHLDDFLANVADHPSIDWVQRTRSTETVKISDFLTDREWRNTGLYQDYFRKLGLSHQVAGMFPMGSLQIGYSMNRGGGDFREEERTLLSRLARHMPGAWRNAAVLSRAGQTLHSPLRVMAVTVDARGMIVDESPAVRAYLLKYFKFTGPRLPEALRRWLRAQRERRTSDNPAVATDLIVKRPPGRLNIRFCAPAPNGGAYLIFEEAAGCDSR